MMTLVMTVIQVLVRIWEKSESTFLIAYLDFPMSLIDAIDSEQRFIILTKRYFIALAHGKKQGQYAPRDEASMYLSTCVM